MCPVLPHLRGRRGVEFHVHRAHVRRTASSRSRSACDDRPLDAARSARARRCVPPGRGCQPLSVSCDGHAGRSAAASLGRYSTRIGISRMMIHAPSCAFVTATTTSTMPVTTAPKPLMAALVRQPGVRSFHQCTTMPGLRERERDEHADHVERDQRVRVAAEDDEQQRGAAAEAEDPVREREPVALVHELPRQDSDRARGSKRAAGSPRRRCSPPARGSASSRPARA